MYEAIFTPPFPLNEHVKDYAPHSPEREELKKAIQELKAQPLDIPMFIGGKEVRTGNRVAIRAPHDHKTILGYYHKGDESHVKMAIEAALAARKGWHEWHWENRAAVFLKAAELLSGPYRAKVNATTMLGQSKTVYQAEIDAAAELADFFRFNVYYMTLIYQEQPISPQNQGTWNRMEYRPLDGFIFALTPFNFTSIAGNLPSAPAIMGNVVVWKPANMQVYSASILMEVFREAGVPDGVINMVFASGPATADVILNHPDFAGVHFTGSNAVFNSIWKTIGNNLEKYRNYPRIVGETGGKDFVVAHPSAKVKGVVTALSRGAFEYQGQKCSAASRAYIPSGMWPEVKDLLVKDVKSFKMGSPEDFTNFVCAVIDEGAFNTITSYIDEARNHPDCEIIVGGNYDKSIGYFIEPTVIVTKDPKYKTMQEEIFGPVLTIYVYDDEKYSETLDLIDQTSPYGLTGAVFSQDRAAIDLAARKLVHAAGNFYINDKPTGAIVAQQPFGGSRASGTNDKSGSHVNLHRWVSPRVIKEKFVPFEDYRYPFMKSE